jgi:hypothetical protein
MESSLCYLHESRAHNNLFQRMWSLNSVSAGIAKLLIESSNQARFHEAVSPFESDWAIYFYVGSSRKGCNISK